MSYSWLCERQATPIRIFLSHSDKDTEFVSILENQIREYGFDISLVCVDREVEHKRESIMREKTSKYNIFLVLLSNNYCNYFSVDHEIRLALSLHMKIFLIKMDEDIPCDLISKHYEKTLPALNYKRYCLAETISAITSRQEANGEDLFNLCTAGSFSNANWYATVLFYLRLSNENILEVAESYLENEHMRYGLISGPVCLDLFLKNWDILPEHVKEKLIYDCMFN